MAYQEIAKALKFPTGATERYKRLDALDRLLRGDFYDDIQYAFEQEKIGSDYLPLTKRRPSVTYNLARIVIDQSSGSLWVDDEIAKIEAQDVTQQANVKAIGDAVGYDAVMMELYELSAAGSGAVIMHGVADSDGLNEPMIEAVAGKFLRPVWSQSKPNTLDALERIYPITKAELIAAGTPIPAQSNGKPDDSPDDATFWLRVVYTPFAELRYAPLRAEDYMQLGQKKPGFGDETFRWLSADDPQHGIWPHNWGVVPAVYVRSLLFGRDKVDGRCAYSDIADTQVEIARSLSQVGRGFRYSADPLIVRKDGEMLRALDGVDPLRSSGADLTGSNGELVRSVSNVLRGDYSLLEPAGGGLLGTLEYVKISREWALEVAGAMKADASTTKGVVSGKALNKLEEMSRLLVKRQRIAYGTRGLVPIIRLILRGCANGVIAIAGVNNPNPLTRLRLDWPNPNAEDQLDSDPPTPVPPKNPPEPMNEE